MNEVNLETLRAFSVKLLEEGVIRESDSSWALSLPQRVLCVYKCDLQSHKTCDL